MHLLLNAHRSGDLCSVDAHLSRPGHIWAVMSAPSLGTKDTRGFPDAACTSADSCRDNPCSISIAQKSTVPELRTGTLLNSRHRSEKPRRPRAQMCLYTEDPQCSKPELEAAQASQHRCFSTLRMVVVLTLSLDLLEGKHPTSDQQGSSCCRHSTWSPLPYISSDLLSLCYTSITPNHSVRLYRLLTHQLETDNWYFKACAGILSQHLQGWACRITAAISFSTFTVCCVQSLRPFT